MYELKPLSVELLMELSDEDREFLIDSLVGDLNNSFFFAYWEWATIIRFITALGGEDQIPKWFNTVIVDGLTEVELREFAEKHLNRDTVSEMALDELREWYDTRQSV